MFKFWYVSKYVLITTLGNTQYPLASIQIHSYYCIMYATFGVPLMCFFVQETSMPPAAPNAQTSGPSSVEMCSDVCSGSLVCCDDCPSPLLSWKLEKQPWNHKKSPRSTPKSLFKTWKKWNHSKSDPANAAVPDASGGQAARQVMSARHGSLVTKAKRRVGVWSWEWNWKVSSSWHVWIGIWDISGRRLLKMIQHMLISNWTRQQLQEFCCGQQSRPMAIDSARGSHQGAALATRNLYPSMP